MIDDARIRWHELCLLLMTWRWERMVGMVQCHCWVWDGIDQSSTPVTAAPLNSLTQHPSHTYTLSSLHTALDDNLSATCNTIHPPNSTQNCLFWCYNVTPGKYFIMKFSVSCHSLLKRGLCRWLDGNSIFDDDPGQTSSIEERNDLTIMFGGLSSNGGLDCWKIVIYLFPIPFENLF